MSSWLNSNVDFGYTATASLVCHNQGKAAQLYLPLSEYELWLTFCTLLKVWNSVSTAEPTVNHAKTLPPLPCAPHDSCVLHASILLALLLSRLPVPLLPSSPWSRQQDLCWSSLLSWSLQIWSRILQISNYQTHNKSRSKIRKFLFKSESPENKFRSLQWI